jgi:hypothetical protein
MNLFPILDSKLVGYNVTHEIKVHGKFKKIKFNLNYRKTFDKSNCANCKNSYQIRTNDKTFRKCKLIGESSSISSDVSKNYVCDNYLKTD